MSSSDQRDLPERLARIEAYYRGIPAHLLSLEDRRLHDPRGETSFTYGSTPPRLMAELLRSVSAGPDDIFYDLGAGVGQCVLVAACVCRHAYGVEALPGLCRVAVEAADRLGIPNATIRCEDLREVDVEKGTILYCYSTCFTRPALDRLAIKAAEAGPGARVITTTYRLDHPGLELVGTEERVWLEGKDRDRPARTRVYVQRVR